MNERVLTTTLKTDGKCAVSDDDLIAQFIRERGVTQCPTAICAPTTVSVSPADASAHAARGIDPVGDAWRKKRGTGGWHAYWSKARAPGGP